MNLTNLLKISLKALNNNKLRCFLTMLGIIIGVGSVITMLAIGQGSKRSIREQISEMGSNMIMIHPGRMERGGVRQSASDMQTLKLEDFKTIAEEAEYISACSPSVNSSGQFINGANNHPSSIYGINSGKTVQENLFPNGENPVGKVIRFNKIPFRIIGTLTPKGYNSMGMDQDDLVLAPYTTVQKRILAITYLQGIYCSALTEDMTSAATDEISAILRKNHKLKATDEDDFDIRSQEELSSMLSSTTDMMTILLACIAGISLLVGGIGIMNIMYVSVTERTREIGLRMSIGARGIDILSQFLIEAVLISVTGGIIGVVLGIGASWMVNALFKWPVYVQFYSVVLSFIVCTVTGIFFGWYPARKAASLDPIEAIRYE